MFLKLRKFSVKQLINKERTDSSLERKQLAVSLNEQQLADLPSLDRYLYNNWMIQDIISAYVEDLRVFGKREHNELELYHAQFLERYLGVVNDDLFMDSIQEDFEEKFNLVQSSHVDRKCNYI